MNITVKVNTIDRTNYISWPSFTKEDVLNSQVDTCSFETKKYGTKTWKPVVGDEILVEDGTTKIFAGVIVQVEETIEGRLIGYRVDCKDWSQYLDRSLVVERYENMTVNAIIADINTNNLTGFTVANVNCAITVKSIAFNRLPVSKCLQLLAEQVNYSWYVDYDKDIHFFSKNSEAAPFSLTDTAGNYIFDSLRIKDDLSQLRNRVFVRGGEIKGSSRTENFTGDATKKTFALANKFSNKPTITVGGVSKTVGIDYLDQDTSFDCLWNFNEKYIRFVNAPAASAIVVSGTPLVPLIVQIQDDASIDKYGGVYEFSIIDKTIKTVEEARQYATSQLEAYAGKISEGSFETYDSGLRSGQSITVQSDIRSLADSFLIQRVTLTMQTPTDGIWIVELATLRTMGIIDFLQNLLLDQNAQITVAETEVLEKSYLDNQTVQVTETITKITPYQDQQTVQVIESIVKDPLGANVSPDWVLAPYVPGKKTSSIIAAADDGYYLGFNGAWNGGLSYAFGEFFGDAHAGLVFRNINIPQGAIIRSAKLTLVAPGPKLSGPIVRIYGQASDNFAGFSSSAFPQNNKTTAFVDWLPPEIFLDVAYESPDFSNVLQEIINRPGWVLNNSIGIGIINNGSPSGFFSIGYAYEGDPNKVAMLEIIIDGHLDTKREGNLDTSLKVY